MSNHTKGPWTWDNDCGCVSVYRRHASGEHIADVSNEDNAHLIAAAPEMYEILKAVEWSIVDADFSGCPICKRVKEDGQGHAKECRLAACLRRIEGGGE